MARKFAPITEEELAEKVLIVWENHKYFEDIGDDEENIPWWIKQARGDDWRPTTFAEKLLCRRPDLKCLTNQIEADLGKVDFDMENFEFDANEAFGNSKDVVGLHTLDNGFTFLGCSAGGDWESPIVFIIYWDGKKLRGYIPKEGNPWNRLNKSAFGNDEDLDYKAVKELLEKQGKEVPHIDCFEAYDHVEFDTPAIIEDIKGRIVPKEVSV